MSKNTVTITSGYAVREQLMKIGVGPMELREAFRGAVDVIRMTPQIGQLVDSIDREVLGGYQCHYYKYTAIVRNPETKVITQRIVFYYNSLDAGDDDYKKIEILYFEPKI